MAPRAALNAVARHTNGFLRRPTVSLITILTEIFQSIKRKEKNCIVCNLIINYTITAQFINIPLHKIFNS